MRICPSSILHTKGYSVSTFNLQVVGRDGSVIPSDYVKVDLSSLEIIVEAEDATNAYFSQIANQILRLGTLDGFWRQICEIRNMGKTYETAEIRFNDCFGGSGPWRNLARVLATILVQNKLAIADIRPGDDSILTQRINYDLALNACKDTFVDQFNQLNWASRNILLARIPSPR
jgi:hypothetical protein